MQAGSVLSQSPSSPSFNSYSSASLVEIAARVVEEFRQESGEYLDEESKQEDINRQEEEGEEEEEEFEFAVVNDKRQDEEWGISADEIFFNGQIKPFYPLFDINLLSDDDVNKLSKTSSDDSNRSPLGKLMSKDREADHVSLSCSSSEADDLDRLQPGTYCVWTPKPYKESSAGKCKKSNSTGSNSKRWNKFRDLLYRSNSDGKDTFLFLSTPPTHNKKPSNNKAVREHYGRNRSIHEDDKKRSYLPYRQELLGFFSNVNGFSKILHP